MSSRWLFISVVSLLLGRVLASEMDLEKRDNTTLAAPIVVAPSEHWEGSDGTWSTFEIRVGSPEQYFRVLPATSWQETWVVWNVPGARDYVCNTTLGVPSDCDDERGGTFNLTASTSWTDIANYTLGLNGLLGYSGDARYGYDFVGTGYSNSSGNPTLGHQIVGAISSETWWYGMLGLGYQPTNFSGYSNGVESFSDTLVSNVTISSSSWSYTAGAYYRLKSVFGELIFGGYDAARFTPNDVVFTMTGDNNRDIVVSVRAITSTTSSGNTTLMSTPELVFIDSTVPELWLPVDVCQAFESAFGIEMDSATGLYLINGSTHDSLVSLNPNITLTLGNENSGDPTVDIVMPYAAFDLNATAPKYNGTSYYFPLRQAQNSSQYTLGRTFLQEAYVTADYNTRTFNVSQCIFDDSAQATVLAIPSDMTTPTSGSNSTGSGSADPHNSSSGLSGGAIAGIVVGAVAALVILLAILFCCLRGLLCFPSRKPKKSADDADNAYEIDGGRQAEKPTAYAAQQSSDTAAEVPGHDAKVEIAGNPIMHPQELEAEVPMLPGSTAASKRVNGPSSSSGRTTDVSSMSAPTPEHRAELHGAGIRDSNGPEISSSDGSQDASSVSPNSPVATRNSGAGMLGRGRPEVISETEGGERFSPTVSEQTWTPRTPVQTSRFEERWSEAE